MIIPSIDLSQGKAVQLVQGRHKKLEREDVYGLAREFAKYGDIAVIDLDAALERGNNLETVKTLCREHPCRVGGGIRTFERAVDLIAAGAEKVILGTAAVEEGVNHPFFKSLGSAIGKERIIVALDFRNNRVASRGWRHTTKIPWKEICGELEDYASEILFTNIEREGGMEGTDLSAIKELRQSSSLKITAAGGISSLEEIAAISHMGVNAQLGMAIYSGKISLQDAFSASCRWEGLLPTIVCDPASQVMMLAFSNRESLKKTLETEEVWFFSRSRDKLWKKGETSGNVLEFKKIRADCDGDALLITARPRGPACHTGSYSCFGGKRFFLEDLWELLRLRFTHPQPGSYTSSLDGESIGRKLREEAAELDDASSETEIIWETADLLYFALTKLALNNIPFEKIIHELRRRRVAGGGRNE